MEVQLMRYRRAVRGFSRFAPLLVLAAALAATGCATHETEQADQRKAREKFDLADRFVVAGNYDEAQRQLEEGLRLDPHNSVGHYYMGVTKFYLADYSAAEKELRESIRLKERNPDAHNALGLVYNQMGDRDKAMAEYKVALDDPTLQAPERVMLNMALCLDAQGKTDEAITWLRRAVGRNPKYYDAHYELAKLLDRQDQLREAIDEYEVAAAEYSSDPNFHYRLGLAYFRNHEPEKAREHLSKVVSSLPGSEKAAKAREILALIDAGPAEGPAGSKPERR